MADQPQAGLRRQRPELDPPKGVLLLGVQGCGKSLAARAAAGILGVPLVRLDFGALYTKWQGEAEKNLRESLHSAEGLSPCVLWVDEIERLSPRAKATAAFRAGCSEPF